MFKMPYTNFHELNLDWMIDVIKRVDETMRSDFQAKLNEYFNSIMPNVLYDEVAEEISLQFVPMVGDGVHSYTADNDALNILEV